MPNLQSYLLFNGNCDKAMKFYKECLGGELHLITFGQAQGPKAPPALRDKIIHAALKQGDLLLMASDATPEHPVQNGNQVQLYLSCSSLEEVEKLFSNLGRDGKATLPLHDAFWGARFGMLTDKFGVNWMLSFEKTE